MGKILDFFRRFSGDSKPVIHEDALEFLNGLSGVLKITLSEPAQPVSGMMNLQASPEATLVSLEFPTPRVFLRDTKEFRPLIEEELDRIVFEQPTIYLRGDSGSEVAHEAPNGRTFTVRDLIRAVEETERQTRGETVWLGGVDVHHIFFEGIHPGEDGVWEIYWGS